MINGVIFWFCFFRYPSPPGKFSALAMEFLPAPYVGCMQHNLGENRLIIHHRIRKINRRIAFDLKFMLKLISGEVDLKFDKFL